MYQDEKFSMVLDMSLRNEDDLISIPDEIRKRLGTRLSKIQMLPAIAQQALEMLRDPDCSIRDVTKLIEQDLKLATEMLRVANSAIYSQGRPITSLADATVRLGLQQCRNLILTSSFASLIEGFTLEEEWVRDLLWRHGLVTAVVASNINRALKVGCNGEEFSAGLIHDIGRFLVAVALPEQFLEADPVNFEEHLTSQLRQEQLCWSTTHTEVGAWFTTENRLPEAIVASVRYHHFPKRAGKFQKLVALVAVADDMANYVQRNESAAGYDPESNPFIGILEESGVKRARELFTDSAEKILEQSCNDALDLCRT